MVLSGSDRICNLWDIQQLQIPLLKAERCMTLSIHYNQLLCIVDGVITKVVWPLLWPVVFISEDIASLKQDEWMEDYNRQL